MNKLHILITVFFILTTSHTTSWSMLTAGKFHTQKKLPPVLNHTFYKHQEMRKDLGLGALSVPIKGQAEIFMDSLGKQTLYETGSAFLALPKEDQKKVERCLTDDQKLWVRVGICAGLDFYILSKLCNGNEKIARRCCNLPIEQVLHHYAAAKEKMIDYPIPCLKEQHYMVLTENQACIASNVLESLFIHDSEIAEFMAALDTLQNIDPQLIHDQKNITNAIQLYPSLMQRAHILCTVPCHIIKYAPICAAISCIGVVPIVAEGITYDVISALSADLGYEFLKLSLLQNPILFLIANSFCYKEHLKNDVLPQQPTLTHVLKSS